MAASISHGPLPDAAVETADCADDTVPNAPMVMITLPTVSKGNIRIIYAQI